MEGWPIDEDSLPDELAGDDPEIRRRLIQAWSLGYLTAAREVAEHLDPSVRVRSRRGLGRLLRALLGG